MDTVNLLSMRAERLTLLCQLIETYAEPSERKSFIVKCGQAGITSADCTKALLETYELESA